MNETDSTGIEWRSDQPSYEAFAEDREVVQDSLTRLEALQGYRVDTLGRIRDRLMDEDSPPSSEELEQYRQDIHDKMPPAVHDKVSAEPEQTPLPRESSLGITVRPI